MADIASIVAGKAYGIMSKGQKVKVIAVKINKRAGTVDIKGPNGKVLTVTADKLKGLQGRPPADAAKPAAAKAPAAKPVAAPKAAPKPAPAKVAKNTPSYADLLERLKDMQNRLADVSNELADTLEALNEKEIAAPAEAPAKGKGRGKPMAEEEEDVAEEDEDEIDFD
jgi:hypothetical protein